MSSRSAAILCRQCGAPVRDVSGGAAEHISCVHCGTQTPLDVAVRGRMRRHLARVRRADQKVRAILREQIFARVVPGLMARMRLVVFGSVAILLVVVPVVMVGGTMLLMWGDEHGNRAAMVVAALALLVDMVLAVGVFPAGLVWGFRMGTSADREATRSAQAVEGLAQTTSPSRCAQCGGHAHVVIIGDDFLSRCPWCDAPLTARGGDAARAAAETVIAAQRELADASLQRARLEAGLEARSRFRLTIPGFDLRGGIHQGWVDGAAVWIGFETLEGGVVRRLEVDQETTLPGAVWFVRREILREHAAAARHFRLDWPTVDVACDPELRNRFAVFAEPQVDGLRVASLPAVRQVLASLSDHECLHVDPAGASCWRLGGGSFAGSQAIPAVLERARALAYVTSALG